MKLRRFAVDLPRAYPPRVTEFTEPFWRGLGDGVLRTTRCTACAETSFPPKPICPSCWTGTIEWIEVEPTGKLYSWTRIHAGPAAFADELPYAVGVVDLDCGLRLACRLRGEGTEWACGEPVELVVLDYCDGPLLAAALI
jgi:uncharacterized OB-fold protein